MQKYVIPAFALLIVLLSGCGKSADDCGKSTVFSSVIYNSDFFVQPLEIYWGVTGTTRSYTYNWTFGNICTKRNPKVDFTLTLDRDNNTLSNPFSFDAGTYTCLGIQAQKAIVSPNGAQSSYQSNESEIGLQQCFSAQTIATIYPYLVVSFTTLGSIAADSLYLTEHVNFVKGTISYSLPK